MVVIGHRHQQSRNIQTNQLLALNRSEHGEMRRSFRSSTHLETAERRVTDEELKAVAQHFHALGHVLLQQT